MLFVPPCRSWEGMAHRGRTGCTPRSTVGPGAEMVPGVPTQIATSAPPAPTGGSDGTDRDRGACGPAVAAPEDDGEVLTGTEGARRPVSITWFEPGRNVTRPWAGTFTSPISTMPTIAWAPEPFVAIRCSMVPPAIASGTPAEVIVMSASPAFSTVKYTAAVVWDSAVSRAHVSWTRIGPAVGLLAHPAARSVLAPSASTPSARLMTRSRPDPPWRGGAPDRRRSSSRSCRRARRR